MIWRRGDEEMVRRGDGEMGRWGDWHTNELDSSVLSAYNFGFFIEK